MSLVLTINPLITNDAVWCHPTLTHGGGWWALREAEAWRLWCGSRQNSRYGVPSPPLVPVSCRYLLVNRCSFFFPHRRGKFQPDLEKRPNPRACNRVDMALAIPVLSGEATLLHSAGVIPCACSELWWKLFGLNMKKW